MILLTSSARLRRSCWLITAMFVALSSIVRAWLTQPAELALLVLLVWGGALCCIEDQLPRLKPNPHPFYMVLGVAILIAAQWRQENLLQPQRIVLLLPMLQGTGLLLILGPPKTWRMRLEPLLALSLLPLQGLAQQLIPIPELSKLTALLCQQFFLSFGIDAVVIGNELRLAGGGVSVAGACSGSAMLAQLIVVGGIVSLVFPLAQGRWRILSTIAVMTVAPIFALFANTLRIGLLAWLNASSWPQRQSWFDFFHHGEGGLLFSLIAVTIFAPSYFTLQDWLMEQQDR